RVEIHLGCRAAQPDHRQCAISQLQDFVTIYLMQISFVRARDLRYRIQRHSIEAMLNSEQQSFDYGEGQWQLEPERRTLTRAGVNFDRAFKFLQDSLHYVKPYPATGHLSDFVGRAESWPEYQLKNFCFT